MKKTLILSILMIFLITASTFAYDFNEETNLYEFTSDELSKLLGEMKKKDEVIAKQDETIGSQDKEIAMLNKTVELLQEDVNTYKKELKLRDTALDRADETILSLEKENAILQERLKTSDKLIEAEQSSSLDFEDEMKLFAIIYLGKTLLE